MTSFSETNSKPIKHTERFGQIGIYLGKLFRIFMNEKNWKVFPMAAIVSAIVASVCNNVFVNMEGTQVGALAFSCVCIWNGFFNSIQTVCKERPIIKREHRAGMYISSYIVAHMIYQAVLCVGQTIIQLVVYQLSGFPFPEQGIIAGSFLLDFGITLFLITYAADMLALMVSCIVKTTTTAMTVVPFLLIIQLIFSGVAFPLVGIADSISEFTISKWGIRTICTVANYNALPSVTLYAAVNKLTTIPEVSMVYKYLRESEFWELIGETSRQNLMDSSYVYTLANIRKEWLILAGMSIGFALIGMLFLQFIDKDRR
ncbi:MAG: ABC transporter permease [Solobacterium sp.]|nr:ABC transporter permease [Solobacterium sp.]